MKLYFYSFGVLVDSQQTINRNWDERIECNNRSGAQHRFASPSRHCIPHPQAT